MNTHNKPLGNLLVDTDSKVILLAGSVFAAMCLPGPVAHAATCTVTPLHAPYTHIQLAVDNPNCSIIKVPAGVFKENITITRNVTLTGSGFTKTFVDGQKMASVIEVDKATVVLMNMAIVNGKSLIFGGGINAFNGSLLTVNGCLISGNRAEVGGNGIANTGGTLVVQNSFISGNTGGAFAAGGGVFNQNGSTLLVQNSVITGNIADLGGGFLNANGSKVTLQNSILSGNKATNGGGIYNTGTLVVRNNTVISGNNADNSGGGLAHKQINGSSLTVDPTSRVIANAPDDLVNQ